MTRAAIDQLLYLMDEAFKDHPFHSLLANLRSVREDDWHWLPPDGVRSIFHLVEHVGGAKYAFENHAFGDRSLPWGTPGRSTIAREAKPDAIVDWLCEGQRRLRESVSALEDDGELMRPRRAPWGLDGETRWLINMMIQHDLYHSGEINHIRALRQRNDE